MPTRPNELAHPLQQYLDNRQPGARVLDFQFLVSGFESDIYTFQTLASDGYTQSLILRIYSDQSASEKLLREAHGVRQLHLADFPVAVIYFTEPDPAFLGKPFSIMQKLEGRPLWSWLYQVTPMQRDALLDQFGGLLAQLHRLDWRPFTRDVTRYETHPSAIIDELLGAMRALYAKHDVFGFTTVADWLEYRKGAIFVRPCVVHLDFHANNVFVCEDDQLAVIDWTQISIGDYRMDLSWTLMIMGDFGQVEWRDRIFRAYQQAAGHPIENLDYFEVITSMKLLASTVISLRSSPTVLGLRAETAASANQQAGTIQRLAERIYTVTGINIPEVQDLLNNLS
jgi:aminoglycoside phosphotransferase (APT) family kinase protein